MVILTTHCDVTTACELLVAVGMVIVIPISFLMAKVAVKKFELYLTKRSIHYHQAYPDCCGVKAKVIPLSHITSIEALR